MSLKVFETAATGVATSSCLIGRRTITSASSFSLLAKKVVAVSSLFLLESGLPKEKGRRSKHGIKFLRSSGEPSVTQTGSPNHRRAPSDSASSRAPITVFISLFLAIDRID